MTTVRPSTTGQPEGRVLAQPIKIIAVLMTATDREYACADDAVLRMGNPILIAFVKK